MSVVNWLMDGDPVIRWQTMRDLLDCPGAEWQSEKAKTTTSGWVSQFLSHRHADGEWPRARWTGTMWTLMTLIDCGTPEDNPLARDSTQLFLDRNLPTVDRSLLKTMDQCHLGFWLRAGAYFLPGDARMTPLAELLLSVQFADGGWNCRMRTVPNTSHGSFHATFNVLEGLRCAADKGLIDSKVFQESEARAMAFMLEHQMYRSDKTGNIIDHRFTHLAYPSHWHYNILRGLDYMRLTSAIKDERLAEPIERLHSRMGQNGRWSVEKRIPGVELFPMEKWGSESRWVTLRALRILKARQ